MKRKYISPEIELTEFNFEEIMGKVKLSDPETYATEFNDEFDDENPFD